MEIEAALLRLAALSQKTRLEAFRLLVRHEPQGLAAGDLARLLATPQNTLSAHLAILTHAQLVTSGRKGRSIVYRADVRSLHGLTQFLIDDCCGGRIDACPPAPLVCCATEGEEKS